MAIKFQGIDSHSLKCDQTEKTRKSQTPPATFPTCAKVTVLHPVCIWTENSTMNSNYICFCTQNYKNIHSQGRIVWLLGATSILVSWLQILVELYWMMKDCAKMTSPQNLVLFQRFERARRESSFGPIFRGRASRPARFNCRAMPFRQLYRYKYDRRNGFRWKSHDATCNDAASGDGESGPAFGPLTIWLSDILLGNLKTHR